MLTPYQFNKAQTRYNLIDLLLVKAGWNLADRRSIGFETPVDGYDAVEKLFSEDEVEEIMELTKRLIA